MLKRKRSIIKKTSGYIKAHKLFTSCLILVTLGIFSCVGIVIGASIRNNSQAELQTGSGSPSVPLLKPSGAGSSDTQVNEPPAVSTLSPEPSKTSTPTTVAPATVAPAVACNEQLKASYTTKYNSDLAYESSYHDSQDNQIAGYYAGKGLGDSSYYQNAIAQEETRHEAADAGISATYNVNLSSARCL